MAEDKSSLRGVEVVKSPNPEKKWRAKFDDGTHTDFGARGMTDYTLSKDKLRRARYRARHAKDLTTRDPKRAGFLSYYILWGDSTSLQENVRAYRRRFFPS